MKNVVFTGPAVDSHGHLILRADLTMAVEAMGEFKVQSSINEHTTLLVASRLDTVKAKRAAMRGITPMTYPEFLGIYMGGVVIKTGAMANPFTDKLDADSLVPCFLSKDDLAKLDVL